MCVFLGPPIAFDVAGLLGAARCAQVVIAIPPNHDDSSPALIMFVGQRICLNHQSIDSKVPVTVTNEIGVFANMSLAENCGVGTLGDGFVGLGEPFYLGNHHYELMVTYPGAAIPEPSAWLLVLPGLALIWMRRRV